MERCSKKIYNIYNFTVVDIALEIAFHQADHTGWLKKFATKAFQLPDTTPTS